MQPTHTPTPMANAQQPTTEQRLDALELFLQHLVVVIECETHFTAEALDRWVCIASQRMQSAASVPTGTLAALKRLQHRVLR